MSAESQLADLDFHWGDVYVIVRTVGGQWHAWWRAPQGAVMSAPSQRSLRKLIRKDYDARTVPPPAPATGRRMRGAAGGLRLVVSGD
jgi:hypothetical protein